MRQCVYISCDFCKDAASVKGLCFAKQWKIFQRYSSCTRKGVDANDSEQSACHQHNTEEKRAVLFDKVASVTRMGKLPLKKRLRKT